VQVVNFFLSFFFFSSKGDKTDVGEVLFFDEAGPFRTHTVTVTTDLAAASAFGRGN
jgi:hypothetical protein